MTARIDLDALERLAEKATPPPSVTWWSYDELDDGTMLASEEAAYFAALDPVTVAALVRAVTDVLAVSVFRGHCIVCGDDAGHEPGCALAPFAPATETAEQSIPTDKSLVAKSGSERPTFAGGGGS